MGNKKYSFEEMVEITEDFGYSILDSEYFRFYKKINFLHIGCGKNFEMLWSSFLAGHRCPFCSKIEGGKKRRDEKLKKHNLFLDCPEVCDFIDYDKNKNFNPNNFSKSSDLKIWWKCPHCEYSWKVSIKSRVMSGKKCPKCLGLNKPEISKIRESATKKGFTLISEKYINNRSKLDFVHNECGYSFSVSWHGFSSIRGCENCYKSSVESKIFNLLKSEGLVDGIDFYVEYRFDNCRSKKPLPFDFYIPKLNLCIEAHGEQHYKPVRFGGISIDEASKNLKSAKKRDKIKKDFCGDNNINMVVIKYTKFPEVEKIMKNVLFEYGWCK